MEYNFSITKNTNPKQKPDPNNLPFGTVFTDHMFIMDYSEDKGWHDGRIVPYAPIALDPQPLFFITVRRCSKVSKRTRQQAAEYSFSDRI